MNKRTPRPKRRFLRVSLRTLLVLLTVGCVWLGWKVNRAQKQRAAVAWVHGIGGWAIYDCDYENQYPGVLTKGDPLASTWLNDLIGIDFFSNVEVINCEGIKTLSDISPLTDLMELHSLWLIDTSVSDLRPLAHFTNLSQLGLANSNVSDLSPLANLKTLEFLGLSGTEVANLTPLSGLKNLETLQLGNTTVSDVTPLASLPNLSYLDITNTNVSDLTSLSRFPSLRMVYLSSPSITRQDVTTLRKAKPHLYIEYDGLHY